MDSSLRETASQPAYDYYDDTDDIQEQTEKSILDKIIEESNKTEAEKLLETFQPSTILDKILKESDTNTILEKIVPNEEETDKESLLSRIISMFRK